jgi:Flp pilus assembly protein TadD
VAHNNLGSLLFAEHRLDEARAHFERAIAAGPANAEAHNNLGAVLLALGRGRRRADRRNGRSRYGRSIRKPTSTSPASTRSKTAGTRR